MLRLSDLIAQGVVTHPGHVGGAILARRKMRPIGLSSERLKLKKKKKKKNFKQLANIISRALDDKDGRRPHGSQKPLLRIHDLDFPEFKGKDVRKVLGSPEGVRRVIDRHFSPPGSPKRKQRWENAKHDLSHGRLSDAAIKKLLVPHVRVVGKIHPRDEFLQRGLAPKRKKSFHDTSLERVRMDEKQEVPDEKASEPSIGVVESDEKTSFDPEEKSEEPGVPPQPPVPGIEIETQTDPPPKPGIEIQTQTSPPEPGIEIETQTSPPEPGIEIQTQTSPPEPGIEIETQTPPKVPGVEIQTQTDPPPEVPGVEIQTQTPPKVPGVEIQTQTDPPPEPFVQPGLHETQMSFSMPLPEPMDIDPSKADFGQAGLKAKEMAFAAPVPVDPIPKPKEFVQPQLIQKEFVSSAPHPAPVSIPSGAQPPLPPAKKEEEPVVGMDIDTDKEEEEEEKPTVTLPPAKVTSEIQTQTEAEPVVFPPVPAPTETIPAAPEPKTKAKLEVVAEPKVATAAEKKPPRKKQPVETGVKFPDLDKLTKRLAALEARPSARYQPRVQPTIIRGPAGPAGPAGASSSSSSAAAGGPGSGTGQKQKQQIIIARGRARRKKAPSELARLKKQYTAQRKTVFAHVTKTKKQRIQKYTQQVKASSISKKEQRKTIVTYRNKIKIAHETFRKQFPTAGKVKNISTLKVLIGKLSKPSF